MNADSEPETQNEPFVLHYPIGEHDAFVCRDFPEQGHAVLYCPTLRKVIEFTISGKSRRISEGLATESEMADFLAQVGLSTLQNRPRRLHDDKFTPNIFSLSLAITRGCSLACLYCHADAGGSSDTTPEIIDATFSHARAEILQRSLRALHVSFAVGGEPTLRWPLFTRAVVAAKEAASACAVPLHLAVTTNGCYGDVKRRYIADSFDAVLLSIDGAADIHDAHRPKPGGGPSHDIVLESGRFLAQQVENFSVRATVSSLSVRRMPEIVEFFVGNFGPETDIVFEPMVPIGRGAATAKWLQPPGAIEFAEAFWQARTVGRRLGVSVSTSGFQADRLVGGFCQAMLLPGFCVTTNGTVTACERDCEGSDYRFAQYVPQSGQFALDIGALTANRARAAMPSYCNECICKWHCAGDCPDVRRLGISRCAGNRYLLFKHLAELLRPVKGETT